MDKARHFRKAMGGGVRQSGVIAAAARVGVEKTFLGGKLGRAREVAKVVSGMWEEKGGKVERQPETNQVWVDLKGSGVAKEDWVRVGVEEGVKLLPVNRLVCHYQIGEEGVRRLGTVMDRVLKKEGQINGEAGRAVVLDEKKVKKETEELMEKEAG